MYFINHFTLHSEGHKPIIKGSALSAQTNRVWCALQNKCGFVGTIITCAESATYCRRWLRALLHWISQSLALYRCAQITKNMETRLRALHVWTQHVYYTCWAAIILSSFSSVVKSAPSVLNVVMLRNIDAINAEYRCDFGLWIRIANCKPRCIVRTHCQQCHLRRTWVQFRSVSCAGVKSICVCIMRNTYEHAYDYACLEYASTIGQDEMDTRSNRSVIIIAMGI